MSTWKKYNYKSGKDFLKKTKKTAQIIAILSVKVLGI
jgi:hypothetical protein